MVNAVCTALPRLTPERLTTNVIVLHPLIQRLVISTATIHADVTVLETTAPITAWVSRTIASIRACGATPPSS